MSEKRPSNRPLVGALAAFFDGRLGPRQIGPAAYWCALICVVAQAITVLMTWRLWQVRSDPPNLGILDSWPQLPFGWLMLGSLIATLAVPRLGSVLHAVVLAAACASDQLRTQPQFFCVAVLLLCVAVRELQWLARWFLAALWLWAGIHKWLSPDWHGEQSWMLSAQLGLDPASYYRAIAIVVASYEVVLGLLAIFRPRWSLWLCVPLHVGIVITLSPVFASWNETVLPWNLTIASVGSWLLWQAREPQPASSRELAIAIAMLTYPAGYYAGWVDHYYAFVLYSDNVPRGFITTREGSREIDCWSELNAAFPHERRLLHQYFRQVAHAGSKLHVADPRWWLGDEYWLKNEEGGLTRLSLEAFVSGERGAVEGTLLDSRRSVFHLSMAGARLLKRSPREMIYAAEIQPDNYRAELLAQLAGLPNLEQLQLRGCPIDDEQLENLPTLRKLHGIGLERTPLTNAAIASLRRQPHLRIVQAEGSKITAEALESAGFSGAD